MVAVVLLRVLRLGDRRELREGDEVRQRLELAAEVDHDRLGVRGGDTGEVVTGLVRALVGVAVLEEVVLVGGAAGQLLLREGTLDRVGDVLGLDRGAVLVLEAVLERVGPVHAVRRGLAQVGGEVGHEHALAVDQGEGGQRTVGELQDGGAVLVELRAGVHPRRDGRVRDRQRAALLGAGNLGRRALGVGHQARRGLFGLLGGARVRGARRLRRGRAAGCGGRNRGNRPQGQDLGPAHVLLPLCENRTECPELRCDEGKSPHRRVVGSNASRIESPSRLSARTSRDTPMTGGQR